MSTDEIVFKRNGVIYRGDRRVGKIEDAPLRTPGRRWRLVFSVEAHLDPMPEAVRYDRLRDAKEAARAALGVPNK